MKWLCTFVLFILSVHISLSFMQDKCNKGFFLINQECYERCPEGTYADNYTMTCKKPNGI